MSHNLDELRIRFHSLLETLCDRYNLGDYIGDNEPEDIYNNWDKFDAAINELNIWCATGATKFVIGDDKYDYIIKIQPPCIDDMDYCAREVAVKWLCTTRPLPMASRISLLGLPSCLIFISPIAFACLCM